MAKTKRKWPVIAGVVFIVGFVAAMILSTAGNANFHCEVCMAFNGRTACRSAAASTKMEAQRNATELACSDLGGSGLSPCRNGAPVSLTWKP